MKRSTAAKALILTAAIAGGTAHETSRGTKPESTKTKIEQAEDLIGKQAVKGPDAAVWKRILSAPDVLTTSRIRKLGNNALSEQAADIQALVRTVSDETSLPAQTVLPNILGSSSVTALGERNFQFVYDVPKGFNNMALQDLPNGKTETYVPLSIRGANSDIPKKVYGLTAEGQPVHAPQIYPLQPLQKP